MLTASSIGCETCASTSAGEAPGSDVRTLIGRQIDRGKSIHAETEIADRANDDHREDQHRREDRPPQANLSEPLHLPPRSPAVPNAAGRDSRPRHRRPQRPTALPPTLPRRRPVRTFFSKAFPSFTTKTFSMPTKLVMAASGTHSAGSFSLTTISAWANKPGRNAGAAGTSASTNKHSARFDENGTHARDLG